MTLILDLVESKSKHLQQIIDNQHGWDLPHWKVPQVLRRRPSSAESRGRKDTRRVAPKIKVDHIISYHVCISILSIISTHIYLSTCTHGSRGVFSNKQTHSQFCLAWWALDNSAAILNQYFFQGLSSCLPCCHIASGSLICRVNLRMPSLDMKFQEMFKSVTSVPWLS